MVACNVPSITKQTSQLTKLANQKHFALLLEEEAHIPHERLGQDGEARTQEHLTSCIRHHGTCGRTSNIFFNYISYTGFLHMIYTK